MAKETVVGSIFAASTYYGDDCEVLHVLYAMKEQTPAAEKMPVEIFAEGDVAETIRKISKGGVTLVITGTFQMRDIPMGKSGVENKNVLVADKAVAYAEESEKVS